MAKRPTDKREHNEMTKANFFHYYNKLSGCDAYLIFFKYKKNIYVHKCSHIAPRWTVKRYESSSKGGWMKYRMELNNTHKKQLLAKSTLVMTEKEFNSMPYSNDGHKCEYWLHNITNQPGEYKRDVERFDKRGDITIDGIKYQVKFENATLTNVNAIHNAQWEKRTRG